MWPIAAVTAHRKIMGAGRGQDGYSGWAEDELIRVGEKLRDEHGCTTGVSGMALGGDTRWALAVIGLGMELEAHIPGPWQADRWPRYDKDLWHGLLSEAARVVSYSDEFHKAAMFLRNDGMLARASVIVAVYDNRVHGFSGTWDTFEKAVGRKAGGHLTRPVIHIDPMGDEKTHLCRGVHCGDGVLTQT